MVRTVGLSVFTTLALAVSTAGAWASFTIEGDADAMTLVADGNTRSEIVAAITKKFAIETVGSEVDDGVVTGRFTGTLGQILKSILPRNGYAIAYNDGRPIRVTFTGLGVPSAPGPALVAPVPANGGTVANAAPMAAAPVARAIAGSLEQRAVQRLQAVPNSSPQPQALGKDATMQQQIAEATARALVQLKGLTADLQKNSVP